MSLPSGCPTDKFAAVAVCDVVVVGSYPPMPGPATASTIAAVRRAWDKGEQVQVVSYRTGAATLSVPVTGPLAGWRLEQVRRHLGNPAQVVLGLEAGVPFSSPGPLEQLATALGLAIAMRRFGKATLLVGEDPNLSRLSMRALASAVGQISVATRGDADRLVERYGRLHRTVTVQEVDPYPMLPAGVGPPTEGLYGPSSASSLSVVELPATTLAQRARARLNLRKSLLLRRLRGR
jgi:hypothetical protein